MIISGFIISGAVVNHVNGNNTPKELTVDTTYMTEDIDGKFICYKQFTFPVPYRVAIGDFPELVGKTVEINIK